MSRDPKKLIVPADPDDPNSPSKPTPPPAPKKRRFSRTTLIIGAIILIFICGGIGSLLTGGDDTEPEPAADVAGQSAATDEPAEEAQETDTTEPPEPTNTPRPTSTPRPTRTPRPTDTPAPTLTPTPAPEPIVLTGSGDDIVDVEKWPGPALARITGNSAGAHFAVINYDAQGNQIDLLVNTTDPYSGMRPLDLLDSQHTTQFEVKATGDWTIEVLPFLENATSVDVPGTVSGTGDAVLILLDEAATASVTGNAAGSHFAVLGYGGLFPDLLVNTTEPYDGEVRVAAGSRVFVVTAVGDWTIELTAR